MHGPINIRLKYMLYKYPCANDAGSFTGTCVYRLAQYWRFLSFLILVTKYSSSVTSYVSIDLFPPRLIVSTTVFQVLFVHSVYNSALFLPVWREASRCVCDVIQCYIMNVSTITLLFKVISGYMFRLKLSHLHAYINNCVTRYCAHFGIPSCLHSWNASS